MKVIKTDARYKYHTSGFVHIIEFKTTLSDRQKFQSVLKAAEDMYGPSENWTQQNSWGYRDLNPNYRVDYSRKQKRRRIYLKTERDLTFLLLKGQAF